MYLMLFFLLLVFFFFPLFFSFKEVIVAFVFPFHFSFFISLDFIFSSSFIFVFNLWILINPAILFVVAKLVTDYLPLRHINLYTPYLLFSKLQTFFLRYRSFSKFILCFYSLFDCLLPSPPSFSLLPCLLPYFFAFSSFNPLRPQKSVYFFLLII